MAKSSNALIDFVKVSEMYRKKFSEELRQSRAKNDEQKGQMFELDQSKKLFAIQYNEVNSQLHMIYKSVNAITNAKALEDAYQMEKEKLTEHLRILKEE